MKRFASFYIFTILSLLSFAQTNVGTTTGEFSVSPTGAATYTIPIPLRDGYGGFTPQLALTYNSQAGNGVVGYGWSISGLSSVTATPHTKYHDEENIVGINVDAGDAYTLDGMRLLLKSGNNGKKNAYYTTEEEQYCRIYIDSAFTTTPKSFVVQRPDGTTLRYGSTNTGIYRYTGTTGTSAFGWMLDYAEDKNGNYTKYIYTYYNGLPYLTQIQYGLNKNNSGTAYCSVLLGYDNRTDTIVTHVKNKKFYTTKRLSLITCKYYGTQYNKFQLVYNNASYYSHLTAVKEFGADNTGYPATTFQWTNLPSTNVQSQSVTVNSDPANDDYYYITGDVDNDGKAELLCFHPTATGNGNVSIMKSVNDSLQVSNSYSVGNYYKTQQGWLCGLPINIAGIAHFGDSQANTVVIPMAASQDETNDHARFRFLEENHMHSSPLVYTNKMPTYAIADFDKDGKDVILYIEKKGLNNHIIRLVTLRVFVDGTPGVNESEQTLTFSSLTQAQYNDEIKDCLAADYDNDGLIDLLIECGNFCMILWNTNGNFNAMNYTILSNIKYGDTFQLADFNGDGLVDLLINEPSSTTWKKAINTGVKGTSLFSVSNLSVLSSRSIKRVNDDDMIYHCTVQDFNADGLSDVMVNYKSGNVDKTCWLKSERDGTFTVFKEAQSSIDYLTKGHNIAQGDFDGDGYVETLNYGGDLYTGGSTSRVWHLYKNASYSINNNKITSITNGLFKKTNVSYCSLVNNCTNSTSVSYPLMRFCAPLAVVNGNTDVWNGTSYVTEHTYKDAIMHLAGKGFLGFKTQASASGGMKQITTREINENFYDSYIDSVFTTDVNEVGIQGHTYIYGYAAGDVAKSFKKNLTEETWGDIHTNKRAMAYHSNFHYGNPINTTIRTTIEQNITRSFQDFITDNTWILALPLTIDTEFSTRDYNYNLDKFYEQTAYTYGHKGRVINKREYKSDTPNSLYLVKTSLYQYDNGGNIVSSKSLPYTNTTDTLITTQTYDTYGRLTRTVAPDGHAVNYAYNARGLRIAENDEWFSTQLTSEYDGMGRLVRSIKRSTANVFTPDTTTVSYNLLNTNKYSYKVTTTHTNNPTTTEYYDGFGRNVASGSIHFYGNEYITEKHYLNASVVDFESVPHLFGTTTDVGTTYAYDSRFRPTLITDPDGNTVETAYYDNSVDVIQHGDTTHYEYNDDGSLNLRVDSKGNIYYFYKATGEYDKIQFIYLDDPDVFSTYTYDNYGRLTQLTDPNGDVRKYMYNAKGLLQRFTWGTTFEQYTYNIYGDLTRKYYKPQGGSYVYATYTYDSKRQLTNVNGPNFSEAYSYNASGQLTNKTRSVTVEGNTHSKSSAYAYNGESQIASITSTLNGVSFPLLESYSYQRGWTKNIKLNHRTVWNLTGEDSQGRVSSISNRLGSTSYAFDNNGQITSSTTSVHTSSGNTSFTHSYTYDDYGRISAKDGKQYTYDDYNQLVAWNGNGYSYDLRGNIAVNGAQQSITYNGYKLQSVTQPQESVWGRGTRTILYNGGKRPYRISLQLPNVGYDSETTFNYDSEGNRISAVKNNYLEQEQVVNGNIVPPVLENDFVRAYVDDRYEIDTWLPQYSNAKHYYYVGGDPLTAYAVAEIQNGQLKLWQIYRDHQGSITEMADSITLNRYYYDPWGRYCDASGNMSQSIYAKGGDADMPFYRGYLGQEHFLAYGLIHLNARVYDPFIGRFLSPDPVYDASRSIFGFNPYVYGNNCPSVYVDPDGEFAITIFDAITDLFQNVGKHGFNISQYNWNRTINSWKIDMGMFKGNFGQVLNKWNPLGGLLSSVAGNLTAQLYNSAGLIDSVTELEGMLALSGPTGDSNSAFTIGHYSMGPKGYRADWRDNLFVHEYGHYIQSQKMGFVYFTSIGIPSLISASKHDGTHKYQWYEMNASTLGAEYFDKHYGRKSSRYKKGKGDYFDINAFRNGGGTPYLNPRIGLFYQDQSYPIYDWGY